LLIHGARSVLTHAKEPDAWLEGLKRRRPAMTRTIWAVTATEQDYQRGFQSLRLQAA